MTEISATKPAISLSWPLVIRTIDIIRNTSLVEWHGLPTVQPGQFWLVELPPGGPGLAPLEYRALSAANVVLYDRALAPTVAEFLPPGGYAEPAPASDGHRDTAAERCVGFARDGWSVARLLCPAECGRDGELRQLSQRLLTLKIPADLSVSVFGAVGDGTYEESRTWLDRLADGVDFCGFQGRRAVTIILDAVEGDYTPCAAMAPANGLAG